MTNPQDVKPKPTKEQALDEALADSFPASDPVSPGAPHRSTRADERHIAEHIVSREDGSDHK